MKIAFYGRVSTVSQAERDLSLPDQQCQVEAWARDNGHSIVARFVDAGKSATNDRRPEFRKMIAEGNRQP
jgi:DNA invertase Pin-like site-specific DNA recombinase